MKTAAMVEYHEATMHPLITRATEHLVQPLASLAAPGGLPRLLVKTAAAVIVAVLLVHAFTAPGLSVTELLIHMSTLTASFILGLVTVGWLIRNGLRHQDTPLKVGHLWLISATGFTLGLLVSGLVEGIAPVSQVADKAASLHGQGSMLPRLMPVWLLLTVFIVRAETLCSYAITFEALRDQRAHAEHPPDWDREIHLGSGSDSQALRLSELVLISAEENYCRLRLLRNGQPYAVLLRSTLTSILDALPDSLFVRVHRSHAVNRHHVDRVMRHGRQFRLSMAGQADPVPISRRRLREVLTRLGATPGRST